jgi:hypothetical protein
MYPAFQNLYVLHLVKFQEMGYSLPAVNIVAALRAIDACFRRRGSAQILSP